MRATRRQRAKRELERVVVDIVRQALANTKELRMQAPKLYKTLSIKTDFI